MTPCWVCGSQNTSRFKSESIDRPLRADDLRISDARYGVTLALRRCQACGFVFAGASVGDIPALYAGLDDPGYIDSAQPRALQMRWLLDRVLRAAPAARSLLDVGAGVGLLVAEAQRRGLTATGIEPSRRLADHALELGYPVLQGTLPHPALSQSRFDVVTLVDVIEHVGDPVRLLADCRDLLATGGVVVVVTPDISSLAARLLGRRWWHFRLAHIGYFNRSSLAVAARAAGLDVTHVFSPRWFFQVRYLAERATNYGPAERLNRAARSFRPLRWLYDRTIALDLHDSMGVLLARTTTPELADKRPPTGRLSNEKGAK